MFIKTFSSQLSYDSSNDDNSDDYERISLKRSKKKDAKPKGS